MCETCGMLTHDTRECLQLEEDLVQNPNLDADEDEDEAAMDQLPEEEHATVENQPLQDDQNLAEDNDVMDPEDYDGGSGYEADSEAYEETWDDFEAAQAIVSGKAVAQRRRRFLENRLENDVEEPNQENVVVQEVNAEDHDDHIILEMEERRNREGQFQEDGSFWEANQAPLASNLRLLNEIYTAETDELVDGPSQKKQRDNDKAVDKFVISSSTQPEFDALKKLREDYSEPETSSPWRSQTRGAVGPIPPPVP